MFDPLFMMFAQASSGDFTYGHNALDEAAAYACNHNVSAQAACLALGLNYNSLLNEEKQYLENKIMEG